jgi:hypothetical protein
MRGAIAVAVLVAAAGAWAAQATPRPVLHVVLMDVKDDAPPGEADAIAADARRRLAKIPGVQEVRTGGRARADRQSHIKDYDVAIAVRLSRVEDLAVYAGHPEHKALLDDHDRFVARYQIADFFAE